MKTPHNRRNIPIMYAISFFQSMVFYASISTLYRQARGVSLAEFALIDSFSYIFQLVFEIPFGMIADRIGYRKTLILSNGLNLIGRLVFWQAYGFGSFLVERLLFSMALAGLSGVDSSILYLSCEKEQSQKAFSRYGAAGTAGMLLSCLIFSLFLSQNYAAAAFGTVISYSMVFVLSFFIEDVKKETDTGSRPSLQRLLDVLRISLRDRKFLCFILSDSMVAYGTWAVCVMLNQGKYLSLGLTEQHIGWIEIAFSVFGLIGVCSAALTRKLGFRRFMVTGISIFAVSALVMGLTGNIAVAIFSCAAVEIVCTLLQPLTNDLYSKRVSVSDRATQLSVYSMIVQGFMFLLSFVMSRITARSHLGPYIFCTVTAVCGIFLFLFCYQNEKHTHAS